MSLTGTPTAKHTKIHQLQLMPSPESFKFGARKGFAIGSSTCAEWDQLNWQIKINRFLLLRKCRETKRKETKKKKANKYIDPVSKKHVFDSYDCCVQ